MSSLCTYVCLCTFFLFVSLLNAQSLKEMMSNAGHRSNIAADSIYLWSIANYVIDPEICQADIACKALIDNAAGTPTY